jgi:hypothetical protein
VLTLEGRAAEAVAICGPLTRRAGATARMANNCGIAQAAAGDRNAAQATLSGRINADDLETIATGLGGSRTATPVGSGPARAGTPVRHAAPAETAAPLAALAPAQAAPGASPPATDPAIGRRSVHRSASPAAPEAAPPAASDAQAAAPPASGTEGDVLSAAIVRHARIARPSAARSALSVLVLAESSP